MTSNIFNTILFMRIDYAAQRLVAQAHGRIRFVVTILAGIL
jgi:hypothetical protein